jgi:gliding motility-associated-like protein
MEATHYSNTRLAINNLCEMKQLQLLFGLLFLSSATLFGQVQVCLGDDATVCQGQTVQITNCTGGSGGAINLNAPTTLATGYAPGQIGDDNWSNAINIGFPFSFYGTTYTQCCIGSNGLITFNTANAGGGCAWSLAGVTLPSTGFATARNTVMGCYQDLNPLNAGSGPIQYQTIGTAPNRQFVVLYKGVTMFSCTNACSYIGIVLYEGTNIVETFIADKAACPGWNGNLAIQGTENAPGTVAHITPGRNNTVWTANQDGRRWIPTSPSNTNSYTMSQIPFLSISSAGGGLQWQNTLGQVFPYNGGVLNVANVPPGTTGYFLTGTGCNNVSLGAVSDTTWITRVSVSATATATTDYCNSGQGTATATPSNASLAAGPFTYLWTPSGQTTQTATNLVAGPYSVTVTNAAGCTATISVTVPNTDATYASTSTQVSCPGGADGTATATMTPELGNLSYQWDDPAAQTTQTATGLAAGTYTCTVTSDNGCTGTTTVTVTEIPGMVPAIASQTDPTCNSGSDGIITVSATGGTPGYTYTWDNSSSTYAMANDLPAGTHTATIMDANGCTVTISGTLGEPAPLSITTISPDAIVCPENTATLTVTGTGGSSAYTFTWAENGTVIGTGSSIIVDPSTDITQYCVTMSEACGSPTTDSCMTLTFPEEIVPSFLTDIPAACAPATFQFMNNSNNQTEIATVLLEFGDGNDTLLIGSAGTPHIYENDGIYSAEATITSIYGCVTNGQFPDIVEVIAIPDADFNFSSNPATIFETSVVMQDKSSPTVNQWSWSSPASEPAASSSQNPTLVFPEGVTGVYPVTLTVTTPEGCSNTVTRNLNVVSDILFFAPNAFTPDGDEFNQTWKFSVIGIDQYNFDLVIFNRWGEVIFETKDPEQGWDGTYNGQVAPAGAYTWRAKVKALDSDLKDDNYQGTITLIR